MIESDQSIFWFDIWLNPIPSSIKRVLLCTSVSVSTK